MKKKANIFRGSVQLVLLGLIVWGFTGGKTLAKTSTKPSGQIELTVVSVFPTEDNMNLRSWKRFKELINRESKEQIILKYMGGPGVFPGFDQPEALRKGAIDMILCPGTYYPLVPEAIVINFTNTNPMEQRKSPLHELIIEAYKKSNARYIGRIASMNFDIYLVKPIVNLTDLSGMKLRSIPLYEALYRKLNVIGVTMPNQDAYSAFERGLVQGGVTTASTVVGRKWHEVLKYRIVPSFYITDISLCMNLDKWNQLPKDIQDLIIQCMIEVEEEDVKFWATETEKIYTSLEKQGIKAIQLSRDDAKKFLDAAESGGWEFLEQNIGREKTAKLRAAISKN